MRWDFLLPPRSEDIELGALRHEAIERWWEAFAQSAPSLETAPPEIERLDRSLAEVHPELRWEIAPSPRGRALRIAARKELRPLVSSILARAPRLSGWEFTPFRPADPEALGELLTRHVGTGPADLRVSLGRGEGNRIDLHFSSVSLGEGEALLQAAQLASEALLGEELLERWVGVIETEEEGAHSLPVRGLREAFQEVREGIWAGLPDLPRHELIDDCEWTAYKLEPIVAEDYPLRRDVIAGTTSDYDLVRTLQAELPFSSLRFSRQGEVFAYLKLERGAVSERKHVEWREELAQHLNLCLGPFGGVIGGASGYRYVYLDLSLCDVASAIPVIRRALQEVEFPPRKRSWLLFCDDVWRAEWVGVWDETPPPPSA